MDTQAISQPRHLGESAWLALFEFAIVAAIFEADIHHHIYISKTPYLFLLGWASLRLRGLRWKDVGFARPHSWANALAIGVTAGLAIEVFELFVSQPLLARWIGKMPDLSDFSGLVGNWKLTLSSSFCCGFWARWAKKLCIADIS
jgi:hypothetical protein